MPWIVRIKWMSIGQALYWGQLSWREHLILFLWKSSFCPQPVTLFSTLHTCLSELFYHFFFLFICQYICFLLLNCEHLKKRIYALLNFQHTAQCLAHHSYSLCVEWMNKWRKEGRKRPLSAKAYNFAMVKSSKWKETVWFSPSIDIS